MSEQPVNPLPNDDLAFILGCLLAYRFVATGFIAQTTGEPISETDIIDKAESKLDHHFLYQAFPQELTFVYERIEKYESRFREGYIRSCGTMRERLE